MEYMCTWYSFVFKNVVITSGIVILHTRRSMIHSLDLGIESLHFIDLYNIFKNNQATMEKLGNCCLREGCMSTLSGENR